MPELATMHQDQASITQRRAPLFRHLMVCLDRSAGARRVLEEASDLAALCGATLTAVRVLSVPRGGGRAVDPLEWDMAQREEVERIRYLAGNVGAPDDMQTLVVGGPIAGCLVRTALETDADLAVIGTGERHGLTAGGLGGTARSVVESIASSVLIVPPPAQADDRSRPAHRVLVPLDGSPHAEAALRIAVQIAHERSAELVLLHALSEVPAFSDAPPEPEDAALWEQITSRSERHARARLDRIRRMIPANGMRSRIRILKGEDPRRALARAVAEENGGLLVLSTRGNGNDPDLPVGSTADYLISHSRTPVLLVREDDRMRSHRAGGTAPRWPGMIHTPS